MKNLFLLTLLSCIGLFAKAQVPDGYFNDAAGLTGYELKTALSSIITNGHVDMGYGALYSAYVEGDTDPEDGYVWDMYSENPTGADPYNFTHNSNNCGTYSAEGDCYNREHLMPQSVFNQAYPMRSDYFHVIPTDGYVNGRRSNYAFGEVSSPTWTSLNGSKVGPCDASLGYTGTVFEPIDEYKGDIARSLFYFATRYESQIDSWSHPMINGTEDQVFSDWFLALLLKWHKEDPVSSKELMKNTAGYNHQGNANPFISHPEWVECIWENNCSTGSLRFTSAPITEAIQDNVYTYNVTFDGEENGTFTITKESTDTWLSLTNITNNSATLTGTPLNANIGTTAVSLKISDGTTEVYQNFNIEVVDGNILAFTSTPAGSVNVGEEYSYDITAVANEGASLTLTGTSLPTWLSLSASTIPSALSGTPSATDVGTASIVLSLTDGSKTITQEFDIEIINPVTPEPQTVFINEIHYDNASTDEGEAVEIAGPAGTDLTGWSIVLYNGSNGSVYGTTTLSGTIPDLQNGYGTVSVAISGIQNGAPDGIALVDASSNVVQFLSYEGSFVAVGGAADGMTSEDIGVSESSSTLIGESLQLSGSGKIYSDFTWQAAATSTFDAINNDQAFEGGLPPTGEAFINEIHYDNSSTDVNEAIELAGTAGTDLTGWSLVLYNGSNGSVYNTTALSGTIPDQQNGYGTLSFAISGIQNGSPDGIALVDASNNIIEFLSYEGFFEATDGPALGLTSIDIGIAEGSSTPVGNSMQLIGEGTTAGDFFWASELTSTFDAVNNNQSFGAPTLSVVINEFVFNHTSTDTDEFVEIFSNANTDLSEYTLLEIEGDGTGGGVIDGVWTLGTTDANGYFTITASNEIENGTVTLLLVKNFTGAAGDDLDTDNDGTLDTTPWDVVVDDVGVNDGGSSDLNYATVVLAQDFDGSSYTVGGASRIPNGTDTDSDVDWVRNDYDGEGLPSYPAAVAEAGEAINTPGAENRVKEVIATIVINEIDADTEGTDILEFVELYDGGVGNASFDGYVLVFYNGSNDLSYAAYDLDGYTTDANGYFVLGNEAVANVSIVFGSNGLQNGADAVALYQADATDFPSGTALSTINLIDAIVYDTNDGDDAGLLTLLNAGEPQVNEGGSGDKDIHSLQRYPNGEGGLRNTSTYVAALPTPGAANTNAAEQVNLVINEVDADTEGTDVAEFIELYDGGVGNSPLDGFVVVLYNGNGDASYNAYDLAGYTTNAEGYFVLGNEAVENVGLVFPSNGLQNGADAVALYNGSAADFPNGTAVTTTNLVDALVYDTDDSDDTGLLVLLNADQPQVNERGEGNGTGHSSQRIPNGEGGARNTLTYTQAIPTPGTENGGGVPSEPISILEARNAANGTVVKISGVLTVSDQFNGSAYIQDETGAIAIYSSNVHGQGLFNIGDSITITGTRSAYNDQAQIGDVTEVVNNGVPNNPILPIDVTLAQLGDHPAELVRVVDATFSNPGDLIFGNSNLTLTDVSGSGAIRIDADVTELVGFAQPETCSEVIGVVGRYYEIYQLMPRMATDMPCAEKWQPSGNDLAISKDLTLDVATWNIEWFGDEENSPAGSDADVIQKDSVKAILLNLDADIIGVEEIADDALMAQLVSEMPGYEYVLSEATSYPNGTGVKQKVGFIYKTATVSPVSTKVLLASAHPYYNGGDASLLGDFPDADKSRFFASGRLPFMFTADVTINGATERISFVDLHARANNNSDAQARYDMRRYDVEALKDTLDTYYANENIVMLGDYNDDVDVTVVDVNTTESSFVEYVNDAANYNVVSSSLSDANYRSYVFYPNMIDHIMLSNELSDKFIDGSARVHYEVYNSDFVYTTSDHMPVSARLLLETLEIASSSKTNVSCAGNNDGTATVTAVGGAAPYTYEWSDGQTTQTAIDLAAGNYTVFVTDATGATASTSVNIEEATPMAITMVEDQKVYYGYEEKACTVLSATEISGGSPAYTYEWSTGETSESITACPSEATVYTLTVTDANNCSATGSVMVDVEDVSCGSGWFPRVTVCFNGWTFCVPSQIVPYLEQIGITVGSCNYNSNKTKRGAVLSAESFDEMQEALTFETSVFPNPFAEQVILTVDTKLETADIELEVYTTAGELVHKEMQTVSKGKSMLSLELGELQSGVYLLKTIGLGENKITRIVKE